MSKAPMLSQGITRIRRPTRGLARIAAALAALFCWSYLLEGGLRTSNINLTIPLSGLLVMVVVVRAAVRGAVPRPMLADALVSLLALSVVGRTVVQDPSLSIQVLFASFIPYYVGRMIGTEAEGPTWWLGTTIVLGIAGLAIVILQLLTGTISFGERAGLGAANPVAAGELFGALLVSVVLKPRTSLRSRILSVIDILLALLALAALAFVLGARGAALWALLTVAAVSWLIVGRGVREKYVRILPTLCGFVGLLRIAHRYSDVPVMQRWTLTGLVNDPAIVGHQGDPGRLERWRDALNRFAASPILGNGFEGLYSHNLFLDMLAGGGIIAFVLALGASMVMFSPTSFTRARSDSKFRVFLGLAIFFFLYRLSSFSVLGHKTLFLVWGLLVTMRGKG